MRALTDSEARVIAVLLASRPERERERLRTVDVPRSTYHAVRRRAYHEGWLLDRYVPHPVAIGRPFVTFLVVRPFADRFPDLVNLLSGQEGTVVVWAGTQVVLAVLFGSRAQEAVRLVERVTHERLGNPPQAVTVRADGPTIPVYFDFEGLWSHLVGLDGTIAYPHGLGGALDTAGEDGPVAALSAHQRWALSELLRRPFDASGGVQGGHLGGAFGLPFSQRRLLQRGWIGHRTILDPARLPPFRGRTADQVVLLTGTPKAGARPELLFGTLTRESQVFPFLFATAPDRWLLAALGGSTPPSAPAERTRRPVLPTLREYLEGIDFGQEPAAGFSSPVDHRYDRLLPASAPRGSARPSGPPEGRPASD